MDIAQLRSVNKSWFTIAGEPDEERAKALHSSVQAKITKGEFTWDEVAYVSKVSMNATSGALTLNEKQLEKIRRACQLWDVDIRLKEVSSHRKFIGPIIVGAKRLLYPILQAFLKDFIRQQRSFNAAILAMVVDLYASSSKEDEIGQGDRT